MAALGSIAKRLTDRRQREGWMELLMSDHQRLLFRRLQATMSLLEGYSNHIMNQVGEQILPNFHEIKDRIEKRQKRTSVVDRAFARLTGLNVKMEQYRQGEAFVNTVVERKGIDFMNRAWSGPETLPSLEEIKAPDLWIRRMEAAAA